MLRDIFEKRMGKGPDFSRLKRGVNAEGDNDARNLPEIPDNMWKKCNFCGKPILTADVKENLYRCPKCGGYFRVHAYRRVEILCDEGSFQEWDKEMPFVNPLDFPGYKAKVDATKEKFKLDEAVISGECLINGERTALCICDGRFIMSSMGYNVGEKITRAIEKATEMRLPIVIYCCSGGARMQEGIISLMQMAKTSEALKRHHDAGLLYISVLTNPTTGGVTASFAMLGDVILAEPKALIGFAGPRVIEQTIRQKLPEGFQRSEFLLKHGFVDAIVKREDQKEVISEIIRLHDKDLIEKSMKTFGRVSDLDEAEISADGAVNADGAEEKASGKTESTAWQRVLISRDPKRPTAKDYMDLIFDDFIELHGDRCFGDDGAVIGGLAYFHGLPVTVIAQQKGKNTKDNILRNFGMPLPEGYRKALRLMKQADDFRRPIICLIDTPGAYPGMESEERGQGEAIARCLYEMSGVKVPVVSLVVGEGGSGGALALAVSNEVWMLENAIYSILSPEGFASILYKDSKKAPEAAEVMKITAADLKKLNVIEKIIREDEPASSENIHEIAKLIDEELSDFLARYKDKTPDDIARERYDRFRSF